ncbi:MAG: glycosyltransferase family protein [Pikeienuella sp.]
MTRIAFLVTHLSGSGHLVRVLALARAASARGAAALVLSGGRPLPHLAQDEVALHQLPALTVRDLDFSTLRHPDGRPASSAELAARRDAVVAALAAFGPDLLVTETFPFGRRALAEEFTAAIACVRARPGTRIVASVRDIPEPPKKPGRLEAAAERIRRDYDAVLVHGEAALVGLDATWPLPVDLAGRVQHTGYVGPPDQPERPRGETVVVAGGGGDLGRALLAAAAEAAVRSSRPWHLLVGGVSAAADATALCGPNVTAEPLRPDYPELLAGAACSVSLAGYNTVMDLAACRTPAILVPAADKGEVEQSIRAARLRDFPGITVIAPADATPERLAEAAEVAAQGPRRDRWPWPRDGAARAAAALCEIAR